jgi:hypothetical protein
MLAVRLIEQVGAYAGLAAIPGLAVLSALYFSQARDVRRLREWAGRAPERAAEQAMGGRVPVQGQPAAQPQAGATPAAAQPAQAGTQPAGAAAAVAKPAPVPPGAKPGAATPAGKPGAVTPAGKPGAATPGATPAVAAAAGAQPATAAGPVAAEADKTAAAGAAASNGEGPSEAKPATPATDKPAALTPAAVASAAAAKAPAKAGAVGAAGAGATAAGPGPPAVGGVKPPGAGAPLARRPMPSIPSSQTSILTPRNAPKDRWYRRLGARLPAARYIALIVAGALVLGGGAAFGISQLASTDSGGGSDKSASPDQSSQAPAKDGSSSKKDPNVTSRPAVNPADVTVTVVNGTTIPNLARDTAAKLSQLGFQIGNKVTGTGSLAAAESVVEYRPGAEDEARYVAAKLNISQKQPADRDALAQAGPAQVIVVLGADQAPGG